MAKEKEIKSEWKPTTKWFPLGNLKIVRVCVDQGDRVLTANGYETTRPSKYIDVTTNGYTPENKQEEDVLLKTSKMPHRMIIESNDMPKSKDAIQLQSQLAEANIERASMAKRLDEMKAAMVAAGMNPENF